MGASDIGKLVPAPKRLEFLLVLIFPSRQARSAGNSRTVGEGMEALCEDEALAWLEERGFNMALEMFFDDKLQEA
jgi:hypothetical protein